MNLMKPLPDFNRPIEALVICHSNIVERMEWIEGLVANLRSGGMAAFREDRERWQEVISFIDHSIANHTRDEEEGLFPMLAGHLPVETLISDHREAERLEGELRSLIESLSKEEDAASIIPLAECGGELASFYRAHIAEENERIFPMAERVLNEAQKEDLGMLMRKHRRIEIAMP